MAAGGVTRGRADRAVGAHGLVGDVARRRGGSLQRLRAVPARRQALGGRGGRSNDQREAAHAPRRQDGHRLGSRGAPGGRAPVALRRAVQPCSNVQLADGRAVLDHAPAVRRGPLVCGEPKARRQGRDGTARRRPEQGKGLHGEDHRRSLRRRRGGRRSQGRTPGDRRFPQEPERAWTAWRTHSEGCAADGPDRNRQDAAGASRRGRGRRGVLLHQRLRGLMRPRSSSSTSSMRWARHVAPRPSSAVTTSASRP
jgi:hypothetical protein